MAVVITVASSQCIMCLSVSLRAFFTYRYNHLNLLISKDSLSRVRDPTSLSVWLQDQLKSKGFDPTLKVASPVQVTDGSSELHSNSAFVCVIFPTLEKSIVAHIYNLITCCYVKV